MKQAEGRECTACKTFKPFNEFRKDAKGKFGYQSRCRECTNISEEKIRRKKGIKVKKEHLITDQGRECTGCLTFKPFDEFNKSVSGTKGYRPTCKECDRTYLKNRRQANRVGKEKPSPKYLITDEGRECTNCTEFKPYKEFNKSVNGTNGYNSRCRECVRLKKGSKQRKNKYLITDEGRECVKCKEFKLYSEYPKEKKGANGYKNTCFSCYREYQTEQRRKKGHNPKIEYVITEEGRECTNCSIFKPFSEFNKTSKGKTGYVARCRECDKKYYLENADHIKARVNEYRLENEEAIKERKKQDYIENAEYVRARVKRYQEENKELLIERKRAYRKSENGQRTARNNNAKRKKRFKDVGGDFTYEQRQYILERDNWRCQACGVKVHDTYKHLKDMTPKQRKTKATIDHIIPVSKGGTSVYENGQVLCYSCNCSKRDRIKDIELQLSLF